MGWIIILMAHSQIKISINLWARGNKPGPPGGFKTRPTPQVRVLRIWERFYSHIKATDVTTNVNPDRLWSLVPNENKLVELEEPLGNQELNLGRTWSSEGSGSQFGSSEICWLAAVLRSTVDNHR